MPDDTVHRAVDYDHDTPEHAQRWPEQFAELREKNPRPWSEKHGGFWVATKYNDILKISQKLDTFSTHKWQDPKTGEWLGGGSIPTIQGFRQVPNDTENPEWGLARTFLNPWFAPKAIAAHQAKLKQWAAALVDLVIETGEFDIVDDMAAPLPALITLDILGFPTKDWREFSGLVHGITHMQKSDPGFDATVQKLVEYVSGRSEEELAKRRKTPTGDLISYIANGTMGGKPLTQEVAKSMIQQLVNGGVDTTTSLTSQTLVWLARNPKDRQRLIDEPALMQYACEEFMRYFTPIHVVARTVTEDVDIDGWRMKKGERVQIAWSSANRDPEIFDEPEKLKIDRFPNRHIGFGMGQHRCLGSFLARLLWESMVGEVLRRMPDYTLIEETVEPYKSVAFVNGLVRARARFTPGKKVGATLPV